MEEQNQNQNNADATAVAVGSGETNTPIVPQPADTPYMPPTSMAPVAVPSPALLPAYAMPAAPVPNYAAPVAQTNAWAIISLVSSILGWVGLFVLGGIVGVVTGIVARSQIKANPSAQTGDGLALAGIILGAVNIVFGCLIALCIAMFIAVPLFGSMPNWR